MELEEKTFSTDQFASITKGMNLIKFDATNTSIELIELKQKYSIVGLPTILFFDSSGTWRADLTLNEFENIVEFSKRVQALAPGQL